MMTLAELCTTHGIDTIDFLKIDVEGAEADVLPPAIGKRFIDRRSSWSSPSSPITNEPAWEEWEGSASCTRISVCAVRHAEPILCRGRTSRHPGKIAVGASAAGSPSRTCMRSAGRRKPKHPDHQLASDLVHGFLARLPFLTPELLASLLNRENKLSEADIRNLQKMLVDEQFRMRLGRIACGYDGGQVDA